MLSAQRRYILFLLALCGILLAVGFVDRPLTFAMPTPSVPSTDAGQQQPSPDMQNSEQTPDADQQQAEPSEQSPGQQQNAVQQQTQSEQTSGQEPNAEQQPTSPPEQTQEQTPETGQLQAFPPTQTAEQKETAASPLAKAKDEVAAKEYLPNS